jgi:hypothetical protein
MDKLLLFSYDANSANMTIAYLYFYKDLYLDIEIYIDGPALKMYDKLYDKYKKNINNLVFKNTDTVVTGTSGLKSYYEMNIIKKAKQCEVKKIITIVDNTSNFDMRFSIDNEIIKKDFIPSEIWVFDLNFTSNITYLNNIIIYKENIYLQYLKLNFGPNLIKTDDKYILKYKNKYLLIMTEYIYELYGIGFNFTEYDMLENIFISIDESKLYNIPIFLKLHPKEHSNKFNILLRKYSHLNIIKIKCNIQELVFYSKIVFGINSSVFKECQVFNKPTYSIQIDTNNSMKMILNYINVIINKYKLDDILNKYFKGDYYAT